MDTALPSDKPELLLALFAEILPNVAPDGPMAALAANLSPWLHCKTAVDGGRSGIRTHEPLTGLTVFKTVAFVRSAILPTQA
jgi:hypothetical protein